MSIASQYRQQAAPPVPVKKAAAKTVAPIVPRKKPAEPEAKTPESEKAAFDRKAYQREYMKKRRAK